MPRCSYFSSLPGAVLFALFGARIVEIWSAGHLHPGNTFIAIMAVGIFAHSIWYLASNLLIATNRHQALAQVVLATSVIAIALSIPAAVLFGLDGVALALIAGEILCGSASILSLHRAGILDLPLIHHQARRLRAQFAATVGFQ